MVARRSREELGVIWWQLNTFAEGCGVVTGIRIKGNGPGDCIKHGILVARSRHFHGTVVVFGGRGFERRDGSYALSNVRGRCQRAGTDGGGSVWILWALGGDGGGGLADWDIARSSLSVTGQTSVASR